MTLLPIQASLRRSFAALACLFLSTWAFGVPLDGDDPVQEPLPALDRVPEPEGPKVRQILVEKYEVREAVRDGWETEVASEELAERLKKMARALEEPGGLSLDLLASLVHPRLEVSPLRPKPLAPAFVSPLLQVLRGDGGQGNSRTNSVGAAGLLQALRDLISPLEGAGGRRVHFKIFRILPRDEGYETVIRYTAAGQFPHRSLQQNALWRVQWSSERGKEGPLRMTSLGVDAYEEVEGRGEAGTLFADCTEAVLGRNPSFREQLLPGLASWWNTLDRLSGITFRGYQGLALGDVNGDGMDDLFVAQPGGLPDRLFLREAGGTARDISREAGIDYLELTKSALLVDLDNDGDQDLVLVKAAHVILMENDGRARFRPRAILPLPGGVSVSAADYDGDGRLDLYGLAYRNPDEGLPPTPYHDANNGEPNRLFRNHGDFRFTEVTSAVGLDQNNRRYSFAAAWEDYDNDGDQDLYVANDFGRNNLYRNDDGRFLDVAAEAGVEDISAGMGVTWADVDGDGWMDLYVSNMFSSAGGRVAYQRRFLPHAPQETRTLYQRHARGNSLFRNQGDGTFSDVSDQARVTMGRWAWGAIFADLNNDGRPDLVVPNGYLTNDQTDDL